METIFKVAITVVILFFIYYQLIFVRTVWRSQIDPQATFSRLLEKLKPASDVIATRDPTKIYQSGNPVGDVTGGITQDNSKWVFKQISNTTSLRTDQPFDYQRVTLRILSVGSRTGMLVNMTDEGTTQARDVLGDAVCELVGK